MKIRFLIVFLILLLIPLAGAEEINPQKIGYVKAEITFSFGIETDGKVENLNYSFYALPPDFYEIVPPANYSVERDRIGNRMIVLEWKKFSGGNFSMSLKTKNYAEFNHISDAKLPYKPPREVWEYLRETNNSRITDSIREKANELKKDYAFETVASISDWIHRNINYSPEYGNVLKNSDWVFKNKKGTCDEFSNLFIAMSRSVGIPSRYVAGAVYSRGGWGYHGWAEVYIGEWVPVDPTWNEIGWLDATHIPFGVFKDSGEVRSRIKHVGGKIIRSRTPQLSINIIETKPISASVSISHEAYPKVIGINDSSVIEAEIKNRRGCLAFAPELISSVDKSGKPIVSVGNGNLITVCAGKTEKIHFLVTPRKNLDENFIYSNLAYLKTTFTSRSPIDLKIDPQQRKKSFIEMDIEKNKFKENEKIPFHVRSDSEYRLFSDLPLGEDYAIASKLGQHYIIAITEYGKAAKKEIYVEKELDFKITDIQKPDEISCGEKFNVSFQIQPKKPITVKILPRASEELSVLNGWEENITKTKKIFLNASIRENCTGSDQFILIQINDQTIFQKIRVKKPKQEIWTLVFFWLNEVFQTISSLFG